MADQTVATEAKQAADKVEAAVAAAPKVEAKAETPAEPKAEPAPAKPEPKAEAKPAPAKAPVKAAKAKAPVRKAASARRIKAATAAKKPAVVARKVKPAKPAVSNKTQPVRAGAKLIKQGAQTMNKQTKETLDTGIFAAEQFKNVFGDVNERAKTAMERSAKIVEELTDLTRGNVEAIVASSKVAAKGVEALSQDAAEYSRKSFEEASAALKSFAEVKSATDFFKLQSDYARSAFDNAVAESARLSETVLKIAGDVAEPITSRYTVAADRVKTLAA